MKILAFGEAMLRFTVPEAMLLEQSDTVRLSTVGTGVNLLASLAHMGYQTELLTCLPDNAVGRKMAADIRKMGIMDQQLIYTGQHIGSFFVELGYGSRPERVIYQDRLVSAFCTTPAERYSFEDVLPSVDIVHICGITLSLSENTRQAAFKLAELAHAVGKLVCFDFNYRVELNRGNSHEQMKRYYQTMLESADVVFGSLRDLTDLLDYQGESEAAIMAKFVADYQLKFFAGSKRSYRNGQKFFSGFCYTAGGLHESTARPLQILDRIGSGDAFASGIITGIIEQWSLNEMLDFAVANSVLAQSAMNDSALFTKADVHAYLESDGMNELLR